MPGLEDLYREIILDHYRSPRNRGELPVPPAHRVEGFNPLCGDEVVLFLDSLSEAATDQESTLDLAVRAVADRVHAELVAFFDRQPCIGHQANVKRHVMQGQ